MAIYLGKLTTKPIGKIGNQKRISVKEFDAFFEKVIMERYYRPPTFSDEQAAQVTQQILQAETEKTVPQHNAGYNAFAAYVMNLMRDPAVKAEYEEWLKKGAKVG